MGNESNGKASLVLAALVVSTVLLWGGASAQQTTYLSLRPDGDPYCFYINFGEQGSGDYSLSVADPGYPAKPWASIHAASFWASKNNIVIVPVCINAAGRRLRDEAMLSFTVQAPPAKNTTFNYGVCVRRNEDIDSVESDLNPCAASTTYTDVFSAALTEREITAKPGEDVRYGLAISSEYPMSLLIDKVSGPSMKINATKLYMPGSKLVDIDMTAPQAAGEYPFSLKVYVEGCTQDFCQKSVDGKLTVSANTSGQGFSVSFAPEIESVSGANPKVFRLTVRNLEAQQTFKVQVDVGDGLQSDFREAIETIGKNAARTFVMTVVPKSEDAKLHTITASVEDNDGMKKTATAALSVSEVAGDLEDDGDPQTIPDADQTGDTNLDRLQKQKAPKKNVTTVEPDQPKTNPATTWIIIIAAVAAVGVAGFFVYKKTKTVSDEQPAYFAPADAD
jgi:LPXTG-motif cell wall-anchored protein